MAPFGNAVGLVEHPAADLPLSKGFSKGAIAKLLRRDEQNADTPEADAVQHLGAFGHGEKTVDRRAAEDAARLHARHLVGHQRHQRGNDHRQFSGFIVPGQGGDLITKGLAAAGGKNREEMLAAHGGLDDGLLQRPAVRAYRLGAKLRKSKPAAEFLAGVMTLAAPGAGGVLAGDIPQEPHQLSGLGELVVHPGRHHRVSAGHRKPCERVGQGPALLVRVGQ